MKRRTRMFDSRDARVHCSLSKYTLLIDQGRDHVKIKYNICQ